MFNNILSGVQSFIGNLFRPKPQEQMLSPLPPYGADPRQSPDFLSNLKRARENISSGGGSAYVTPESSYLQYDRGNLADFGTTGGGGGGTQTTSFGMPGELVGALRDVNGITYQHQGGD